MYLYLSTLVMSEVTTIELVRQETETSVPKIIASDESDHNDLGLEWMLIELMPGQPLRKRWKKFYYRGNLKESGTSIKLKRKRLNL